MGSPRWAVYREFCSQLLLALQSELKPDDEQGLEQEQQPPLPPPPSLSLGVLSLDYRLAPEHLFPSAVEDAVAAYAALLRRGVSAPDVCIAGDSAGGNLVLALALAADRLGLPPPGALVALSPWGDLTGTGESMSSPGVEDPLLPADAVRVAARALTGRFGYASTSAAAAAALESGAHALSDTLHKIDSAIGRGIGGTIGEAVGKLLHSATDAVLYADTSAGAGPATAADAAAAAVAAAAATAADEAAAQTVLSHPLASPSRAAASALARLPSTLILSGAREILLSDSIAPFEAVRLLAEVGPAAAADEQRQRRCGQWYGPEARAHAQAQESQEAGDTKAREVAAAAVADAAEIQSQAALHEGDGPASALYSSSNSITSSSSSSSAGLRGSKPKVRLSVKPTLAADTAAAAVAPARVSARELNALQSAEGDASDAATPVEWSVELSAELRSAVGAAAAPAEARGAEAKRWELSVWPGMFHVFPLAPFLPESKAALQRAARFAIRECQWDAPKKPSNKY
jgi:acetyl esterase/lipase